MTEISWPFHIANMSFVYCHFCISRLAPNNIIQYVIQYILFLWLILSKFILFNYNIIIHYNRTTDFLLSFKVSIFGASATCRRAKMLASDRLVHNCSGLEGLKEKYLFCPLILVFVACREHKTGT